MMRVTRSSRTATATISQRQWRCLRRIHHIVFVFVLSCTFEMYMYVWARTYLGIKEFQINDVVYNKKEIVNKFLKILKYII